MTAMIEVQTAELIGPALDWAMAKAEGDDHWTSDRNLDWFSWRMRSWKPSTDWAQGGPLIESAAWALPYRATSRYHLGAFEACTAGGFPYNGSTPLIASCRAIAANEFGDVVSVPAELVQGVES